MRVVGRCTAKPLRTTAADLERLWSAIPLGTQVSVIMEPTRNAWVPLASWFRRHGAEVVRVPPERAADLRAYYTKHTKTDPLDSRLLPRLPLLHPEGLHPERGLGPGDPLRRATKLRSTLVHRVARPSPGSTRCSRSWVPAGWPRSAGTSPR